MGTPRARARVPRDLPGLSATPWACLKPRATVCVTGGQERGWWRTESRRAGKCRGCGRRSSRWHRVRRRAGCALSIEAGRQPRVGCSNAMTTARRTGGGGAGSLFLPHRDVQRRSPLRGGSGLGGQRRLSPDHVAVEALQPGDRDVGREERRTQGGSPAKPFPQVGIGDQSPHCASKCLDVSARNEQTALLVDDHVGVAARLGADGKGENLDRVRSGRADLPAGPRPAASPAYRDGGDSQSFSE